LLDGSAPGRLSPFDFRLQNRNFRGEQLDLIGKLSLNLPLFENLIA